MLLLKETTDFQYKTLETAEKKDGELRVTGLIQRANALNHNGRVYSNEIMFPKIEQYIETKVKPKKAYGEAGHLDSATVEFERVSHIIDEIWFEGDEVYANVRVLPTEKGKMIKVFFDCGTTVGISSRALGTVTERNGINYVNNDLHFVCWDFVTEPSTHQANMFKESRELSFEELKRAISREEYIENAIKKHILNF